MLWASVGCGTCPAVCRRDVELCRASRDEAPGLCALAVGCMCQCRLNAGGCGFSRAYLSRCVAASALDARRALFAPGTPCVPGQITCAMPSGVPVCVEAGQVCPGR